MTTSAAEARAAGGGLVRLLGGAPGWDRAFEFSTPAFVRSFAGPLAALPLYVGATGVVEIAGGGLRSGATLWTAGLAHLIDAFGFPLVLALMAAPLRVKGGYGAFVIVNNWAALYLNIALFVLAPVTLAGAGGQDLFGWTSLVILCLAVFLTWRIARETLTAELAPLVLVVVSAAAWGALADWGARALMSL